MKADTFKDAEALGKIKTTTEALEAILPVSIDEDEEKVFDDANEFRLAIGRAGIDGASHLVISERLMRYLLKGRSDKSVMYEGVRCYVAGAKEILDKEESMSAMDHMDYMGKKGEAARR